MPTLRLPIQCPPLQVAGTRVPLPLSLAGGRVRLERRGGQRRVVTTIGVRVAVGGDGAVTVTAPATLRGQLCGLCAHPEDRVGEGQGTQCCEWGMGILIRDRDPSYRVWRELGGWDGDSQWVGDGL